MESDGTKLMRAFKALFTPGPGFRPYEHLTMEEIEAMLNHSESEEQITRVDEHIMGCSACRELLFTAESLENLTDEELLASSKEKGALRRLPD